MQLGEPIDIEQNKTNYVFLEGQNGEITSHWVRDKNNLGEYLLNFNCVALIQFINGIKLEIYWNQLEW